LLKKHYLSQLESEPECLVDDLDFINDQIADLEDEDYDFVSHPIFRRKPSANIYACQDQVSCI
jgi:hypothetical protein